MLDALIATGCVDPTEGHVAGESNGRGWRSRLRATRASARDRVRVVLVIPAVDEGVLDRCASGAPVAVAMSVVAGELDETVPFGGGNGLLAQEEWFASASWLLAGCTAIAPRAAVDDWTNVVSGTSCETCSVLFVVADGTHTWPGSSRGTGGQRPRNVRPERPSGPCRSRSAAARVPRAVVVPRSRRSKCLTSYRWSA
jgi:poly(3-hydroxybutyrate) depolymerase